jgi:uncharacterized CHY-type Zn-finger protein
MKQDRPKVSGIAVDSQTRCLHWRSALDVIAIKMKCCGEYYACKDCHEALAGHAIAVWPRAEWGELAVLCGVCRRELTIAEYMGSGYCCPACGVRFNPGCRLHSAFYFEEPLLIQD